MKTETRKNACFFYFPRRLDALIGLSFPFASETCACTCVARLQFPCFHFVAGSGNAEQNQPLSCSSVRPHPVQASMISAQEPPLKVHPAALINVHFFPFLVVSHTNMFSSPLNCHKNTAPISLKYHDAANKYRIDLPDGGKDHTRVHRDRQNF